MSRFRLALVVMLALATPAAAQLPFPLPVPRSCEEDRDHLRQLIRMVADGRGQAEWTLAEARARIDRLEQEVKRLQAAALPPAPKEVPK